jgi:hypothetical protein
MRKKIVRYQLIFALSALVCLQACKDDSVLTESLPIPNQTYTESFDNYLTAYNKGWRTINKSNPVGRKWFDGAETPNFGSLNYLVTYYPEWNQAQYSLDPAQFSNIAYPNRIWETAFASQLGSNGYVATSIASSSVINTGFARFDISNWLVSPETMIQNGDKVIFYAYSKGLSRLQVWVNPSNSLNVGSGVNNTGDFTLKLLDINPTYAKKETNPANAFPTAWTRFEAEIQGLQKPVAGRFAFRYYMQDQTPVAATSADPADYVITVYNEIHKSVIGIDEVTFKSIH